MNSTLKEAGFWAVAVIFLGVAAYCGFVLAMLLTNPNAYADGFCTALHGVTLSADVCDVNGKVVRIEKR